MNDDKFRRIVMSAAILTGILLYSSTLSYPQFLFDGAMFLQNNPLFKDLDYYAQLFDLTEFGHLDEQLGLNPDVTTNFMLRPVAYLTFSANYLISGFDPAAFRAVNIAIHILNSLLVFACIELLLGSAPSCRRLSRYSARFITTASAFVFLLHPMQTESVTYITQRFTSLAALFYLTAIWLYLVWSRQKQRGMERGYVRWVSVAVLLLGMLTRESLFTAPIMIVLLDVTVLGNGLKSVLKRAAPHLLLLPVIPLLVIMVSAAQNNSPPTFTGVINVVNYVGVPVAHYALTQMVVVITYLRLYLLPYGQNLDPAPPLYTLPYQLPVIGSALIIVFLVGGSYYLYRRNKDDVRCVLVFTGICWYFLALAVSSSFIPLPDLMAEHRAYLPSVGFIMALTCLIDLLRTAPGTARMGGLVVSGTVVWCVVLFVLAYKRNNVWQSGIHLWGDTVKKSPAKDRPWYNLGTAYATAGNYPEALKCFQKVIEINPDWGNAYVVLTVSYLELKRFQDAVEVSLRGISVDPANPVNYNHLGIAYAELDRDEDARQAFSTALALRPGYENAKLNLERLESFMETKVDRRR